MKYLKEFQGDVQYKAYTASTEFVVPNVSHCVQEDEVHFNPKPTPIVYYANSKLGVNLSDFVPAATAETFADGVGKFEFSAPVTEISGYAFDRKNLSALSIPNTVTTIGDRAFFECTNLSSITISNSITGISDGLFMGCTSLTSVTIPNGVTAIGYMAFASCDALTSIDIPNGVTYIDTSAFNSCTSLTSVTIGCGVTTMEGNVFYDCSGLTSITINATTPPEIGGNVFDNTNDCPIYVPAASVEAYKEASNWNDYAIRIQAKP